MPSLTIVIVNYNTRELLRTQLETLPWPIIVVDNGSTDASVEEVNRQKEKVKSGDIVVIANKENRGFAAANNQGIRAAKSDYVLLLNTDCHPHPHAVRETLAYINRHPRVGAVSCALILPDGSLDPACHRGFPTPWAALTYFLGLERLFPRSRFFGQYHQGYKPMNEVHEVDCISGAFFLVRRDVIREVGLLDEAFFMYGEDIDWCYRIRQAGWKIVYYPHAWALHRKHQSGLAHADRAVREGTKRHFFHAMRLFYAKHYRHRYPPALSSLVSWGITLRSFFYENRD